jgi:hypothetical protein
MWNAFTDWLKQPYSADMDALHWAWFVALMLVLSVLWGRVLAHMGEGF